MERIMLFKVYPRLAKFFIIIGSIFSIFGVSLLIRAVIKGFNFHFPSGDWNSIIFSIQGFLFILIGCMNLKTRKYFIEWDDTELRFFLPDSKNPETLKFEQILSVNIRLFEIELKMAAGSRTLQLDNLQLEDLKKVKEKFENFVR